MATTAEEFLHRTYKSTNVSTPRTKLWRDNNEYESSDESYSEEAISNIDNFAEESKLDSHVSDVSMNIPLATTETEKDISGSERKINKIGKKVMSEGEVLRKQGRLTRMLYLLRLRKRSQSSQQTNVYDNSSASTSMPNPPRLEVQLVGAETPLKKHDGDVKKDVTKDTKEKYHQTSGSRRSLRKGLNSFFNTGKMEH